MDIPHEVSAFYEVARDYCRWADSGLAEGSNETWTAVRLLAALYHRALLLPDVEPESGHGQPGLTKVECAHVYERFKRLPFQYYREVFDPVAEPAQEPVTGDLADDLLDVYVDLSEGIRWYERGRAVDAVFHWRFTFGVHWGRHAVSALRALHCYETRL